MTFQNKKKLVLRRKINKMIGNLKKELNDSSNFLMVLCFTQSSMFLTSKMQKYYMENIFFDNKIGSKNVK